MPPSGTCVSYYQGEISEFLSASDVAILGHLADASTFAAETTQIDAWREELGILRGALEGMSGGIALEYTVPRIGSRVDAVVIVNGVVFVLEFKVGADSFERGDRDQAWDYALDLKNFHQASHLRPIVPVLVCTKAERSRVTRLAFGADHVARPLEMCSADVGKRLRAILGHISSTPISISEWSASRYHPTPTIVEAARNLYAGHTVEEIARSDAGARNLTATSSTVNRVIDQSLGAKRKSIVFVTGVPGAGKTLVGLNIATRRSQLAEPTHSVYLSGNGPLVAVLREALARDEMSRKARKGERTRKGDVLQPIKQFIQNVHHFRDEGIRASDAPSEHVVIFDEAQRAWDSQMTSDFMQRKKRIAGFKMSEPEFLISCMDRHQDWAVIVCLVGSGQEINRGEAGIGAWLSAIADRFSHWDVYASPHLFSRTGVSGNDPALRAPGPSTHLIGDLHLSVSMRSFRAERISDFVDAVLRLDTTAARDLYSALRLQYPLVLSRNLRCAKSWIREQARGTERYGLLASSGAQRLKPLAVDVRASINPIHWFLADRKDVRSSWYLEDAGTEFDVQGLELDWTCVTWDGDLRHSGKEWQFRRFRGKSWTEVRNAHRQRYLLNAYRVLLTRARQGMVVVVPKGNKRDRTRSPGMYDTTFEYLASLGIPVID